MWKSLGFRDDIVFMAGAYVAISNVMNLLSSSESNIFFLANKEMDSCVRRTLFGHPTHEKGEFCAIAAIKLPMSRSLKTTSRMTATHLACFKVVLGGARSIAPKVAAVSPRLSNYDLFDIDADFAFSVEFLALAERL